MKHRIIKTSAPGSIMLAGEYAVLEGELAVVTAIDQRITVELTERNDREITIFSDHLGELHGQLDHIYVEEPFQFVLTALTSYQQQLPHGVNLRIHSDFLPTLGLGSSAAVTVAVLAALHTALNKPIDRKTLLQEAIELVRFVQGTASGADVSASVYGGVVGYRARPLMGENLFNCPPIHLIYSGYKMSTQLAIKKVMGFKDENPEVYQNIMSGIGQCAESAARAIKLGQWDLLGEIFNAQQALMTELLVSDDNLNEIIEQLRQIPTVYGAKISGAGMGDCIVALGEVPTHSFPRTEKQKLLGVKQIYVQVCEQGVMVHV